MKYTKVIRGDEARELLARFASEAITEANVRLWRDICCVNPDLGCAPVYIRDDNGDVVRAYGCPECPLGKMRCHEFYEASWKLRLKDRLKRVKDVVDV